MTKKTVLDLMEQTNHLLLQIAELRRCDITGEFGNAYDGLAQTYNALDRVYTTLNKLWTVYSADGVRAIFAGTLDECNEYCTNLAKELEGTFENNTVKRDGNYDYEHVCYMYEN